MARYDLLARNLQRATWVCWWGLLAAIAIGTLIGPAGAGEPNVVIGLLASLPLLIFAPGMRRGNVYSFAWLSLVSLLYFARAVTVLFHPAWRWPAILHLLFSIALFVCAMLAVRYTARAQRPAVS